MKLSAGKKNLLIRAAIYHAVMLAVFGLFAFFTGGIPQWLSGASLVRGLAVLVKGLFFSCMVTFLVLGFGAFALFCTFTRLRYSGALVGEVKKICAYLLGRGKWWRVKGEVYHSDLVSQERTVLTVSPSAFYRHVHVIGGSGSGKTVSVLQNLAVQHILRGGGLIVLDGKTDYDTIKLLYWAAVKAGRRHEFHLFDLAAPELSETYNPLIYGNSGEIAEKVLSTFDFSDVFYEQRQRMAMYTTVKAIVEIKRLMGRPFNFRDLLWILYYLPYSLDFLYELLKDVKTKEAAEARDQLKMLRREPTRTLFEQTAGIRSQMYRYSYALPDPLMINSYSPSIDLKRAILNSEIVYFSLNSMTYQQMAYCTARLVLQDVQSIAGELQYRRPNSSLPFLIFMDEAGEYLYEEFETFLKQSRSAGFGCVIMHQAVGDLLKRYGDFRSQVESNTELKVILRVNDPETRDHISKSLGRITSRRKIEGKSYGHLLEGVEGVLGRTQEREIEEDVPFLRPETIAALKTGQGIVISGHQMFRVKFNYFPDLLEEVQKLELPRVRRRWADELFSGLCIDVKLKQYLIEKRIPLDRPFPDELPEQRGRLSSKRKEESSKLTGAGVGSIRRSSSALESLD